MFSITLRLINFILLILLGLFLILNRESKYQNIHRLIFLILIILFVCGLIF